MKTTIRIAMLPVCLSCLGIDTASAQGPTTVNDLRAPSTPAVTILGTSPTTIERPDTPRGVVFNLASSIADSGGVPQNYAMQVAPYWLRSHPDLLFTSYVRPTIGQSLLRSFAVSAASADFTRGTGESAEDLGSRLAIGLGTVIVPGRLDPAFDALASQVQQDDLKLGDLLRRKENDPGLAGLRSTRDRLRKELSAETDPQKLIGTYLALNDTEGAIARLVADLDAQIARVQAAILEETKQLQEMNVSRYGAALAVAGAWSVQVPGDVIANSRGEQAGLWLTPSYRGKIGSGRAVSLLGVFRYLRNRTDDTNSWDAGGRAVFEVSDAVAVSGEAVRRWRSGSAASQDSFRAVAMVEARLGDNAYVFASFGRDFTDEEQQRSLVSIVGINLGFGPRPTVLVDK